MRATSLLTVQQREACVDLFEAGYSATETARRLSVPFRSVSLLHTRWRVRGRLCLVEKKKRPRVPAEVKQEVVARYVAGETAMQLAHEFDLSGVEIVRYWARQARKRDGEEAAPRKKGAPLSEAETSQLKREVEKLRAENAYLKKLRDLRNQGRR